MLKIIDDEVASLIEVANNIISSKKVLGSAKEETKSRKLNDYAIAIQSGLSVPITLVTSKKSDLINFVETHGMCITKPLNHHPNLKNGEHILNSKGTVIVTEMDILNLSDSFVPILIQKYIDKIFEIRAFFCHNEIYAMAIFSQRDTKTKYDFRNYNNDNPNRCVPFTFPIEIENNILKFIAKSNLDTGSIDIIYAQNMQYYFLEVNPSGQFGWVSKNCNYFLEEKVAKIICQ